MVSAEEKARRRDLEKKEIEKRLRGLQKLKVAGKATEEHLKAMTRLEERLAVIQSKAARGEAVAGAPKEEKGKMSFYMKLVERFGEVLGKALGRAGPAGREAAAPKPAGPAAKKPEEKVDFTHVQGIGDAKNAQILAHLEKKGIKTQEEAEKHVQEQLRSGEEFISKDVDSALNEHYREEAHGEALEEEKARAEESAAEAAERREEAETEVAEEKKKELTAEERLKQKEMQIREKEAEKKLKEMEKEEKKERKKQTVLGKTVSTVQKHVEEPALIINILIGFAVAVHLFKIYFYPNNPIIYLDYVFAAFVFAVSFIRNGGAGAGQNIKQIAQKILRSFGTAFFILLIIIGYFYMWQKGYNQIPKIGFLFDYRYWPWWAMYGIWGSNTKIANIAKVAHAMVIALIVLFPLAQTVLNPLIAGAELSAAEKEVGAMSRPAAIAACMGEVTSGNLDFNTCVQAKMNPPSQEEILERTRGLIKKQALEAVTATIDIKSKNFYLPEGNRTMIPEIIGSVTVISLTNDINMALSCTVNEKPAKISPSNFTATKKKTASIETFVCLSEQELDERAHKITVKGDIKNLEVNSILTNFFIDQEILQERYDRLLEDEKKYLDYQKKVINEGEEKAKNELDKELFRDDLIAKDVSGLKVLSESDPGYALLNLMTNRIPGTKESAIAIGLSEEKYINFQIGIVNNLKDGKIVNINSGKFNDFPPFLEVVSDSKIQFPNCPINPDLTLNTKILNQKAWAKVEKDKEESFVCRLKLKDGAEKPEVLESSTFDLTINYNYQVEKKGEIEILERS